jgi:ABC-type transport system involved in multi-copper enzyme maturation permease subunit
MMVAMMSLYAASPALPVSWPVHCAVMLGLSALLLLLAMVFVRRAALRQAVGQTVDGGGRKTKDGGRRRFLASILGSRSSAIRRVVGPPVLWKERRIPLLGKRKVVQTVSAILLLGLLALTYGLCAKEDILKDYETHVAYTVAFLAVGLLFTMVLPATCITTERESQTWTLLLTTTVGTWEILGSKFAGAVRRCVPAWLLLFAHIIAFVAAGIIHPMAIVQLGILVGWVLLFLTSTGLYFSTRLRHTTTAVIANMALAAGLWTLFPLFLAILLGLTKSSDRLVKIYMDLNPFTQAGVIMSAVAHRGGLGSYEWMQAGMRGLADATGWIALTCAVYVLVGLVFLTLAAARLRRNPF